MLSQFNINTNWTTGQWSIDGSTLPITSETKVKWREIEEQSKDQAEDEIYDNYDELVSEEETEETYLCIEEVMAGHKKRNASLNELQWQQLGELLEGKAHVIALTHSDLTGAQVPLMKIDTGDHLPVKVPPYCPALCHREFIQEEILKLVGQGILQASRSPWSFTVVVVPKKGGKFRLCTDFRKLNAVTKRDTYQIPRLMDILDL